jgi:hypothetical protein
MQCPGQFGGVDKFPPTFFAGMSHTNEEIELAQRPSRSRVVYVAAVRDRQVCLPWMRLHLLWFSDFCLGFDGCSEPTIRESKMST